MCWSKKCTFSYAENHLYEKFDLKIYLINRTIVIQVLVVLFFTNHLSKVLTIWLPCHLTKSLLRMWNQKISWDNIRLSKIIYDFGIYKATSKNENETFTRMIWKHKKVIYHFHNFVWNNERHLGRFVEKYCCGIAYWILWLVIFMFLIVFHWVLKQFLVNSIQMSSNIQIIYSGSIIIFASNDARRQPN